MQPKGGRPTPQDKLAILERRQQVKALWVRQTPQFEIARTLGVSEATVSKDLAAVRKAIAAALADDRGKERLLDEVAKLDAVEAEAWAEWQRSRADAQTRQAKTVKTPGGERSEAGKREEDRCGDPRYLNLVLDCVEKRCKLLGLLVSKHELTGKDSGPVRVGVEYEHLHNLPADELLRLYRETLAASAAPQ